MKKIVKTLTILIFIILLISVNSNLIESQKVFYGYIKNGRFLVPLRGVFEEFGAEIYWYDETQSIEIRLNDTVIIMRVNYNYAMVNDNVLILDVAPEIVNGRTYVPLRFVGESMGAYVEWNSSYMYARIIYNNIEIIVKEKSKNIQIDYKNQKIYDYNVNVVKIPYSTLLELEPRIVLAKNKINGREDFKSIVERSGAVVAINGAVFNTDENQKEANEPYGFFMNDGKVFHITRKKAVMFFTKEMKVIMNRVNIKFNGYLKLQDSDRVQNFYINKINHTPDNNDVVIYTKEWGNIIRADNFPVITVQNGVIKNVVWFGDVKIPSDGYLILMKGIYINDNKIENFKVGCKIWYDTNFSDIYGNSLNSLLKDSYFAIGCGPALVVNGKVDFNPVLEEFENEKILSLKGQRSAIGVKSDGTLILVTCANIKLSKLAEIMKYLGCYYAMNLDGGASSALYLNGKYITYPGRLLNNVVVFVRK